MATLRSKSASTLLTRRGVPTALIDSVLAEVTSPHTRRSYARGIEDLYDFARRLDGSIQPITAALLGDWRASMVASSRSTSTVNLRLNAVRALVRGAHARGLLDAQQAWELQQIGGMPFRGTRVGNWLTVEQLRRLLSIPDRKNARGARNYLIMALLGGCALRVSELAALEVERIQQREGRWVIVDLPGKGGRVRTVAIPSWVKQAIDNWLRLSKIKDGRLVRQLVLLPSGLSEHAIAGIVTKAAQKIGVQNFGPHDLRRTCARLCRQQGGDIEQIQEMLGHASVVTTQRYLGTIQNLKIAVNDNLGL